MVVFDLVVGILSIVLAVFAIWLSIKLYRMSDAAAERMREAEASIQESVKQLDRLFGLLYSDTFALVRDSYTTMQEQLWRQARDGAGADRPAAGSGPSAAPVPKGTKAAPVSGDIGAAPVSGDTGAAEVSKTHEPARGPVGPTAGARLSRNPALEEFLLAAHNRLRQSDGIVRAIDLANLAERMGYSTMDALNALYELTFVQRKLFLHGNRFGPQAIVAESRERADELGGARQEHIIQEIDAGSRQQGKGR